MEEYCLRQSGRMHVFFFKQKTAYEMLISDWSSDVCSSDLVRMKRVITDTRKQLRKLAHHPALPSIEKDEPLKRIGYRDCLRKKGARLEIGSASCRERVCQYV